MRLFKTTRCVMFLVMCMMQGARPDKRPSKASSEYSDRSEGAPISNRTMYSFMGHAHKSGVGLRDRESKGLTRLGTVCLEAKLWGKLCLAALGLRVRDTQTASSKPSSFRYFSLCMRKACGIR
jgi:hypothetical protein